MFENTRRGRQARNFTTNAPKILDLKSFSEQIFSKKLTLGAPDSIIYASAWELSELGLCNALKRCIFENYFVPSFFSFS